MANTAVETYKGTVTSIPDAHEWGHIERMATMLAKSQMCPTAFKDKPNDIIIVGLSLRDSGVPFTINTLNQCFVVAGRVELMAQLKVAIAARHGWDIWFDPDECDDTKATVHYKAPGKPERTMTYTAEEARKAGLLDEWAETWVDTGEKWADSGKAKKTQVKVTVSVDGVPVEDELPPWAAEAVTKRLTRRKDPWFTHRGAMLMARAVTKALRYTAPHLILGIGDEPEVAEAAAADETGDQRPAERMVPARSVAPDGTTIPESLREPAVDDHARAQLLDRLEQLPDDVAVRVRDAAKELGVPNVRTHRFTKAHGALLVRLIDEASEASGGARTAETSAEVAQPGAVGQLFDENDGRPFE